MFGALVRVCITLAICVGSIGLAIVAFPLADYRTSEPSSPRSKTVSVLSRTTRHTAPAMADLEWSASRQTKAGDVSGKITGVLMSAGVPLECGAPVVAVDGGARLAMCGSVPPWRDVTANTRGPDADQVAAMLVDLGLLSEEDRASGARRAAAWKQLARFLGLPASSVFHPSDVVWIGDVTTPSRITVQVGDRISGDSVLFEVDAALEGATVDGSSGDQPAAADWVFSIEGSAVEFPVLAGRSLDARTFEAMARSTATDPDAGLPTQLQGIVRLASPVTYAAIPPTALVTAPDGSTCVTLADGGTRTVTVVESATGLVLVDANLAEGTLVRDLPPADSTC